MWTSSVLRLPLLLCVLSALASTSARASTESLIAAARADCAELEGYASACNSEVDRYVQDIKVLEPLETYEKAAAYCEPRAREKTEATGGTAVDVLMRFSRCVKFEIEI